MMAALLLLPLAVSLAGGVLYILYLRAAARMMAEAAGEGNLFQSEEYRVESLDRRYEIEIRSFGVPTEAQRSTRKGQAASVKRQSR